MVAVILSIHTLIILTLIGVVLLQRSEGGAVLSGGGFMTGRGTANALTRTTSFLAALFFATSLALAIIAGRGREDAAAIETLTGGPDSPLNAGAPKTADDLLKSLGAETEEPPPAQPAPATEPAPAAEPEAEGSPQEPPASDEQPPPQ